MGGRAVNDKSKLDLATFVLVSAGKVERLVEIPFTEEFIRRGPPDGQIMAERLNQVSQEVNDNFATLKDSIRRYREELTAHEEWSKEQFRKMGVEPPS